MIPADTDDSLISPPGPLEVLLPRVIATQEMKQTEGKRNVSFNLKYQGAVLRLNDMQGEKAQTGETSGP